MAARVSTIWFVDAPDPAAVLRGAGEPDFDGARAIAHRLRPNMDLVPIGAVPLSQAAGVSDETLFVGVFPGVVVVCHRELSSPTPSTSTESWRAAIPSETTYLVASRPEDAWGAFATWDGDKARRSFSSAPVTILEDLGIPLLWERPYWAGDYPLQHPPGVLPDPQSLPFHPQQFAEAANLEWLGFRYTGARPDGELDPATIGVHGFSVYPAGQAPRTAPAESVPQGPPSTRSPGNQGVGDQGRANGTHDSGRRSFLDRFRKKVR